MNKLIINGKNKLYGKVEVKSAKNALLPLIASTVLLDFEVGFLNCSKLNDVDVMLDIIKSLGGKYRYEFDTLYVDCSSIHKFELPSEQAQKIRASVFLLGPLLSKFKKVKAVKPGGCNLGERPIDMHLLAFEKLGVKVTDKEELFLEVDKIKGGEIVLPFKSVGVTENIIMASVLSDGETIIKNAAKEPEIVCLANFLNRLGANIKGAGGNEITITGVKKLKRTIMHYKPITDRIEAGTFILAGVNTGGEIEIDGANFYHNIELIKKIRNNTCKIAFTSDKIYIKSSGVGKGLGFVKTAPYPAFATDLQSPLLAYACFLRGETIVEEGVFKSRFNIVGELQKMKANVVTLGNKAIIKGCNDIIGAEVTATDLRCGAGLIVAGLNAEGVTVIDGLNVIERGYENIDKKLAILGARVSKG